MIMEIVPTNIIPSRTPVWWPTATRPLMAITLTTHWQIIIKLKHNVVRRLKLVWTFWKLCNFWTFETFLYFLSFCFLTLLTFRHLEMSKLLNLRPLKTFELLKHLKLINFWNSLKAIYNNKSFKASWWMIWIFFNC